MLLLLVCFCLASGDATEVDAPAGVVRIMSELFGLGVALDVFKADMMGTVVVVVVAVG